MNSPNCIHIMPRRLYENDRANLVWQAVPDATGYLLERRVKTGSSASLSAYTRVFRGMLEITGLAQGVECN